MRRHTSAYVSIGPHTSAYVSDERKERSGVIEMDLDYGWDARVFEM